MDDEGTPLWISGLANEDPHHSVHVIRGLDPAAALETLGAKPRLFRRWELPDELVWLSPEAVGIEPHYSAILLG
ncbi:hypothetical protein [Nocardia flavorosea]|uniref:hypothetical protein n=1 Tax=Nocardia flavorosea TaxID=53429 RepID=UPI0007A42987|nr:hypothetical protein [Nocardia flavorosea]